MKEHQIKTVQAYDNSADSFSNTIAKLKNYNETYDFLLEKLSDNMSVLDLACGPANISGYLCSRKKLKITGFDLSAKMIEIAKKRIPEGVFEKKSIIDFNAENSFDLIINGFGIPYLEPDQIETSLESSRKVLKPGGLFYISFMDGDKKGYEKTSFGKNENFFIYYHKKENIAESLTKHGFEIIHEWQLDYMENDGSITKDIVFICKLFGNRI